MFFESYNFSLLSVNKSVFFFQSRSYIFILLLFL